MFGASANRREKADQAVAMLLLLGCINASALDADKIAAISNAANSFVTLAGDSAKTGRPPRETDPAAKALIDLVFDTSELQGGAVQPISSLSNLSAWTVAVLKVGRVYGLAGTGVNDIAAIPNDPDVIKKMNNNAATFAPEMGRYYDSQMWLMGAITDTVSAYLSTASINELDRPNVKNTVAKIRVGNAQSIYGLIRTLALNGIEDGWRRDRLAVLAVLAPKAAKFLSREDILTLQQTATEVAGQLTDPEVKAALTSISAGLLRP